MITCTKRYTDFPFAHRQHRHLGHCQLIHGHNWSFEFKFGCHDLDTNGFVVDFGSLQWLKCWLEQRFDHTLVLNEDDPYRDFLTRYLTKCRKADDLGAPAENILFANIIVVPNCGAEGLAKFIFNEVNPMLKAKTMDRVFLKKVTVFEDTKNSATYLAL